jgi:hypothetical protein
MASPSKTTEGWLYVLIHPRMPGWFKVGKTTNPSRRLRQYQTGDPLRSFRFVLLRKMQNHHLAEEALIQRLDRLGYLPHGEWFEVPLCVLHREIAKLT